MTIRPSVLIARSCALLVLAALVVLQVRGLAAHGPGVPWIDRLDPIVSSVLGSGLVALLADLAAGPLAGIAAIAAATTAWAWAGPPAPGSAFPRAVLLCIVAIAAFRRWKRTGGAGAGLASIASLAAALDSSPAAWLLVPVLWIGALVRERRGFPDASVVRVRFPLGAVLPAVAVLIGLGHALQRPAGVQGWNEVLGRAFGASRAERIAAVASVLAPLVGLLAARTAARIGRHATGRTWRRPLVAGGLVLALLVAAAAGAGARTGPRPERGAILRDAWLRDVAARHPPGTASFLSDPGLGDADGLSAFLGGPVLATRFPASARLARGDTARVVLADLDRAVAPEALARAVQGRTARIHAERYLAIELDAEGPAGVERLAAVENATGAATSWLGGRLAGRVAWIPGPDPGAATDLRLEPDRTVASPPIGRATGRRAFSWCPPGRRMTGLAVRGDELADGRRIRGLRAVCERVGASGTDASAAATGEAFGAAGDAGDEDASDLGTSRCGRDEVVVGLHGHAGAVVFALGVVCARADGMAAATAGGARPARHEVEAVGDRGGVPFRNDCPGGTVAAAAEAWISGGVARVRLVCAALEDERREPGP